MMVIFTFCSRNLIQEDEPSKISNIAIFEVYLKDTSTLNTFSRFLQDTLHLPIEWEAFDLFGDGKVLDISFFLGNTTFELVGLYSGDSSMNDEARFNRILFGTEDIEALSESLTHRGFKHEPPSDFNIFSGGRRFAIGRQTTLDSLSIESNVYFSFWQFLPAGLNFAERPVKAKSVNELYEKLDLDLESNPMGVIELKEVHVSMKREVIAKWDKILGTSKRDSWKLSNGPTISYSQSTGHKGIEWITIKVKDLDLARNFLSSRNLLSTSSGPRISIDPSHVHGLQIYLEE